VVLSSIKRYSLFIRVVCGVIGVLGSLPIIIFVVLGSEPLSNVINYFGLVAGFIFIYVAAFGVSPLDHFKK